MSEVRTTIPSMPSAAITIENLGKRYTLGHQGAQGDGLRHAIEGAVRAPIAWLRSRWQGKPQHADFWALKERFLSDPTG